MFVWLIGLSGTGKTTLAREIVKVAEAKNKKILLLDGDVVREIFGNDLGYSMKDRLINAQRFCQMGKFLDDQGVDVVCAILSLFPETRKWNRENLKNYYEVFIDTPIKALVERDSKGIYGRYKRNETSNVAGMDIEFKIPDKPDLVIENIGSKEDLLNYARPIFKKITNNL
jgi:adenylylsulfate kinase